jgi:hypothetical protein
VTHNTAASSKAVDGTEIRTCDVGFWGKAEAAVGHTDFRQ